MSLLKHPPLWRSPTPPAFVLVLAAGLSPLALNMFLPSMPGLIEAFGTTYDRVQLTIGLYVAAIAVFQLVVGPLSDRFGRRPILLVGLAGYLAGALVCLAAQTIETMLVGRVIQAIGACAGMVLPRAMIRDVYGREKAASMMGYLVMAVMVMPMIGPIVGGLLDEAFGWRASFVVLAALGVIVLAVTLLLLPETKTELEDLPGPLAVLRVYGDLLGRPRFLGYAATMALTSGGFFAFLSGAPYVAQSIMGASPSEQGYWFAVASFGYLAGNFTTGRYGQRLGIERTIRLGLAFTVGSCLAMIALDLAGAHTPWAIFLPMTLFAYGNGLTLPSALAAAVSARPEVAGSAAGLSGSMQMGFGFVTGAISGSVVEGATSQMPMALTMLGAGAGAALAYSALRLRLRRGGAGPGPGERTGGSRE